MRIGMGWGGALVGCGSCSSRGVTATVQMRSAGSVRFMRASWAAWSARENLLFLIWKMNEKLIRIYHAYSVKSAAK